MKMKPKKDKLLEDVFRYRRAVVLLSAARAGLFELLQKHKTLGLAEITRELSWSDRAAEILLNALCALGYLEKKNGKYRISQAFEKVFGSENYPLIKEWLMHEWRLLNRWTHLPEVLETGGPFREPEKTAIHRNHRNFILSMAHREKENLKAMVHNVSWEGYHHLLDLGGGPGLFAIAFAEKYPSLKATVFDAAETEPIALDFFRKSSAKDRLQFQAGDFITDDFGEGYDAALLSSILHIYSPEDNRKVLKRLCQAMVPGGKVIIRDFLLNRDKTGPLTGALFAINMLVNTDRGNAYSQKEIKSWLKQAGFIKIRRIKLTGNMALLEAYRK
jgi:3-hydroxy-5-methyl-1-naphthoate 3-O-methyltransferase